MKESIHLHPTKRFLVSSCTFMLLGSVSFFACAPKQDNAETNPIQPTLGQMAITKSQLSSEELAPGLKLSYLSDEVDKSRFTLIVAENYQDAYRVQIAQPSNPSGSVTTKILPGSRLSRVCQPGQNYIVTAWSEKESSASAEEKGIKKEITCPYHIDLGNKENHAFFQKLLADEKVSHIRIQQFIPETQDSTRFAVNGNKVISINYLNASRSKQHPATITFYTLSTPQSLFGKGTMEVAIRKQMHKWDKYPVNRDQLIAEISQRFLNQNLTAQEQVLEKLLPRVVVYVHQLDGRVQWETITTANQTVINGGDIAPQFFSQYIAKPAEKGPRGNNCSEQVVLTPDVCLFGHCIIRRTCSVNSGAGNGGEGKPGVFPGLAGLDSLPPAPGPLLSVISSSAWDSNGELIAIAKSDENLQAPAGKGTPGQAGGEGGDGGTCGCGNANHGEKGAKGKDAPAGQDGAILPLPPTCSKIAQIDGFINATSSESVHCK